MRVFGTAIPDSGGHVGVLPDGGEELQRDHPEHEGGGEHPQGHYQLKRRDILFNHPRYLLLYLQKIPVPYLLPVFFILSLLKSFSCGSNKIVFRSGS